MKQLITTSFLILSLSATAQLDKKAVRQLEKAACAIPEDTLLISQHGLHLNNLPKDSLFGNTGPANPNGWGAYYVSLTDPCQGPDFIDEFKRNNRPTPYVQVKIEPIFMSALEVSNKNYRDYVEWTRLHQPEKIQEVLPDTQLWNQVYAFNAPFVNYYFAHPAYNDYPAVNISHQQAQGYLSWLTDQYNQSPKRKYKKVVFRLPTEAEWMYAWMGGKHEFQVSSWGSFRNAKGQMTANFRRVPDADIIKLQNDVHLNFSDTGLNYSSTVYHYQTLPDTLIDSSVYKPNMMIRPAGFNQVDPQGFLYTTPVASYWPNPYGLFNMSGNVAEFVQTPDIAKGGHFLSTGFFLLGTSRETFVGQNSASPTRGFRWVMEVVEY
ncbi:MAG: formylglycine-generating enzyme family protein [Bacteroidota bacterium]|nr:formylglycine-generating enzyme family protein [Bacteroidota bacterium]MDX5429930.1 formylglycine-generating enzyme family protein [Bacteroidota bacterium]MDX5468703.1 formylglycine-generating enzyme family protein [Bacteroidota bacterium]